MTSFPVKMTSSRSNFRCNSRFWVELLNENKIFWFHASSFAAEFLHWGLLLNFQIEKKTTKNDQKQTSEGCFWVNRLCWIWWAHPFFPLRYSERFTFLFMQVAIIKRSVLSTVNPNYQVSIGLKLMPIWKNYIVSLNYKLWISQCKRDVYRRREGVSNSKDTNLSHKQSVL